MTASAIRPLSGVAKTDLVGAIHSVARSRRAVGAGKSQRNAVARWAHTMCPYSGLQTFVLTPSLLQPFWMFHVGIGCVGAIRWFPDDRHGADKRHAGHVQPRVDREASSYLILVNVVLRVGRSAQAGIFGCVSCSARRKAGSRNVHVGTAAVIAAHRSDIGKFAKSRILPLLCFLVHAGKCILPGR